MSSFFNDAPRRPRPSWFSKNYDFASLGWDRAKIQVRLVCKALLFLLHNGHKPSGQVKDSCSGCRNALDADAAFMAKQVVARVASSEVAKTLSDAVMKKKFHFKDRVWYASQRLQK
jgi:hypothetical protein